MGPKNNKIVPEEDARREKIKQQQVRTNYNGENRKTQREPVAVRKSTSAIVIEESGEAQDRFLSKAKEKIKLPELGIEHINIRRGRTGGTIRETEGESGDEKADLLLNKLLEIDKEDTEVIIRRPCRVAEIKMIGVESSVTKEDIMIAIDGIWERPLSKYLRENVTVGHFRTYWGDRLVAWMRCPEEVAVKLLSTGSLVVG